MERHVGVLVGDTAHFDEVAVCGVCGAVLWVSLFIYFFLEGVGGEGWDGVGWDGRDNGKGKGGKKKRGKRKRTRMIWIMESKSADSLGVNF